jgi:hypothetical protein
MVQPQEKSLSDRTIFQMRSSSFSNSLLVGSRNSFAIESHVSQILTSPSQMGLGYFNVHIADCRYGVRGPDATLLACSFDAVNERLRSRGKHICPRLDQVNGLKLSALYYDLVYRGRREIETPEDQVVLGVLESEEAAKIVWAPDGDEAFDDGSFILQYDSDAMVRLVAFRVTDGGEIDVECSRDIWIPGAVFYRILAEWSEQFSSNWNEMCRLG